MTKIFAKIKYFLRKQFLYEFTFRIFVILQLLGLLGIVLLDGYHWYDLIPDMKRKISYTISGWDFFDERYWDLPKIRGSDVRGANWILLMCLFGPFCVCKIGEWLHSAREK